MATLPTHARQHSQDDVGAEGADGAAAGENRAEQGEKEAGERREEKRRKRCCCSLLSFLPSFLPSLLRIFPFSCLGASASGSSSSSSSSSSSGGREKEAPTHPPLPVLCVLQCVSWLRCPLLPLSSPSRCRLRRLRRSLAILLYQLSQAGSHLRGVGEPESRVCQPERPTRRGAPTSTTIPELTRSPHRSCPLAQKGVRTGASDTPSPSLSGPSGCPGVPRPLPGPDKRGQGGINPPLER